MRGRSRALEPAPPRRRQLDESPFGLPPTWFWPSTAGRTASSPPRSDVRRSQAGRQPSRRLTEAAGARVRALGVGKRGLHMAAGPLRRT
eukprot:3876169-Alexandrium_andersonii.AAC.1